MNSYKYKYLYLRKYLQHYCIAAWNLQTTLLVLVEEVLTLPVQVEHIVNVLDYVKRVAGYLYLNCRIDRAYIPVGSYLKKIKNIL